MQRGRGKVDAHHRRTVSTVDGDGVPAADALLVEPVGECHRFAVQLRVVERGVDATCREGEGNEAARVSG